LLQRLQEFRKQAAECGESLANFALRCVLQEEGITSVIIGASNKTQLDENLKVMSSVN
jgi:L-glyceraldehyde 3-phosphate reductase